MVFSRPSSRVAMPDLGEMLEECNHLLSAAGLPLCTALKPIADGDTANPTAVGVSASRRYVVKAVFRHPDSLPAQVRAANWFRDELDLPVPRHFGHSAPESDLPLVVMEWLPGEQLRLVLPTCSTPDAFRIARTWGRCLGVMHVAEPPDDCLTEHPPTPGSYWWEPEQFENALVLIERLASLDTPTRRQMARFIEDRRDTHRMTRIGVVKADSDLRDFLATTGDAAGVSGMLDWERVSYGCSVYDCVQAFLRLTSLERLDLWLPFREAYEEAAGQELAQTPDVEYLLVCRGVLAAANSQPGIVSLLSQLCRGHRVW